jgi:hypothetical protein
MSRSTLKCVARSASCVVQRCPPAPRDARLFEAHSRKREWIRAAQRNLDPEGNFLSANFSLNYLN